MPSNSREREGRGESPSLSSARVSSGQKLESVSVICVLPSLLRGELACFRPEEGRGGD